MFASFEYEIVRDGEVYPVEVIYQAHACGTRWQPEYDIEIVSVMDEDAEFLTTADEEDAIVRAAYERVEDDFESEADSYGDYIYEMRNDR